MTGMPVHRRAGAHSRAMAIVLAGTLAAIPRPATAAVAATVVPACADPPAPNIVLIFVDDMGYGDTTATGALGFSTPHLERMAAEGVRFTDFSVAQPVCSASRAALLTGCYPNRIGIHGALGPDAQHGIHDDEVTLAELCRSKGYATAIFGKWHLGHLEPFLPTHHGFDEYLGIPYSNDMWPRHPVSPKAWPPLPLIEGTEPIEFMPDQRTFTGTFTARTIDFIRRNAEAERPFFAYLAHPMPHVPLFTSPEFRGRTEQGRYGDVIEEIDAGVGAILDTLEALGLDDETLVIFTSDNGPWLSYGSHAGTTGPLREGKGTTWEGGVRVPCFIRWRGVLPDGVVSDQHFMTIDILPTLARLLDAELPGHAIDGKDVWPLILGEPGATSPHDGYAYWYHQSNLEAVRSGRWKLHLPHGYRSMEGRAGGSSGVPGFYRYGVMTGLELYDLQTDVGERHDVAAQHPEVVERLLELADRWRAELGDTLTEVTGSGVREPGRVDEPAR